MTAPHDATPSYRRHAAFVLAISLPAAAVRADFFDGMFAFDQGDYAQALEQWAAGAKQRDPASLFGLGQLYEGGYGVEADPVRAYALYDIAAGIGFKQGRDARTELSKRMSFQDLSKAQALSEELARSGRFVAAEGGSQKKAEAAVVAVEPAPEPELVATDEPRPTESDPQASDPPQPESAEAPSEPAAPAATQARGRPHLRFNFACTLRARWQDGGSGGVRDVATYDPQLPPSHRMIGSYVQGSYEESHGCVLVVGPGEGSGDPQTPLLVAPVDWQQVWTDKGSGARQDGSMWNAVAPSPEYLCIGSIAQPGYAKPTLRDYVCVHRCLTQNVSVPGAIWTDQGTGAAKQVAFYRLPLSNALLALPTRSRPKALTDLDPTAQCLYE